MKAKIYGVSKTENDILPLEKIKIVTSIEEGKTVIDGGTILTDSVNAKSIAANAITTNKLAADSITGEKIKANTIDVNKLKTHQIVLPNTNYGGVKITDEGMIAESKGNKIILSSDVGLLVQNKKTNKDVLSLDATTGEVSLDVAKLSISSNSVATENYVQDKSDSAVSESKKHTDEQIESININERNLLKDTSEDWTEITFKDFTPSSIVYKPEQIGLSIRDSIVYSMEIDNSIDKNNTSGSRVSIDFFDSNDALLDTMLGTVIKSGEKDKSIGKIDIPNNTSYMKIHDVYKAETGKEKTLAVRRQKLQRGRYATDWTPAPEDARDYADSVSDKAQDKALKESKTYTDNKIEISEDGITLGYKEYTDNKVESLDINDKNLFLGSYNEWLTKTFKNYTDGNHHIKLEDVGLNQGDTITFSIDIDNSIDKENKDEARAVFNFYDKSGNRISSTSSYIPLPSVECGQVERISRTEIIPEGTYDIQIFDFSKTEDEKEKTFAIRRQKLQRGNRATDWTPAYQDTIQESVNQAVEYTDSEIKTAKDGIKLEYKSYTDDEVNKVKEQNKKDINLTNKAVEEAKSSAQEANKSIADMAKDTNLSQVEKKTLQKDWDIIRSEYPKLKIQGQKYDVNTTDYIDSYSSLESYIEPILKDKNEDTTIVPSTFKRKFTNYYDEKLSLMNLVNDKVKELGDKAVEEAYDYVDSQIKLTKDGISLDYKNYTDGKIKNVEERNKKTVTELEKSITQAKTSADSANKSIADMAKNTILSPIEKTSLAKEWEAIQSEYPKLKAQAKKYEVSDTKLDAKYSSLKEYITPLLKEMDKDSTIKPTSFKQTFKEYYDEKLDIMNLINDRIKELGDIAVGEAYEYVDSQIDMTKEGIVLGYKKYTDDKVDAVDVNDRNLLRGLNNPTSEEWEECIFSGWTSGYMTYKLEDIGVKVGDELTYTAEYDNSIDEENTSNVKALVNFYSKENKRIGRIEGSWVKSGEVGFSSGTKAIPKDTVKVQAYKFFKGEAKKRKIVNARKHKLQVGNKATKWTPAPEDLVEEATNESKKYTDSQIKLSEEGISLGYKKYTDDQLSKQEIGGTNLLLDSDRNIKTSAYRTATYDMSEKMEEITYTLTLKGKLGKDKSFFRVFIGDGSHLVRDLKSKGNNIYQGTFEGRTDARRLKKLLIYALPNSVKAESEIEWAKLEKGDTATDWSPSPSDIESSSISSSKKYTDSQIKLSEDGIKLGYKNYTDGKIKGVEERNKKTVTELEKSITQAKTSADSANQSIADMAKDTILSPLEKPSLAKEWETIQSEYPKLKAQAKKYGVSDTKLDAKYSSLKEYITPLLKEMDKDSTIKPTSFKQTFKEYYDEKLDIMNLINDRIKELGDIAVGEAYEYVDSQIDMTKDGIKLSVEETKEYADSSSNKAEQNAKDYSDTSSDRAEQNAKEYADSSSNKAEQNAKDYSDTSSDRAEQNAKDYADSSSNKAEQNAKDYSDTEIAKVGERIQQAEDQIDESNKILVDMSKDDLLTPVDKKSLSKEWEQIQSEYPKLIAQGNKYGTNVRDIEASYGALERYLQPILSQMGENTEINSKEFRSKFKEYYDDKLNLMNSVSDEVRKLGDAAASDAENRANSYTDSQIDITKEGIVLGYKNYTDEKVDNQKAGGRNLLLKTDNLWADKESKDFKTPPYKDLTPGIYVLSADIEIVNAHPKPGSQNSRLGLEFKVGYESEKAEWLNSFYYPKEGENYKGRIHSIIEIKDTITWIGQKGLFANQIEGDIVRVGLPKLERGNVPTDWSPAPEDLIKEATSQSKDYTDSEISLTKEGIELGYKNYTDNAVEDIDINERNYFSPSKVNNLAFKGSGDSGEILERSDYRGYSLPVSVGEIYSISRSSKTNNRFRIAYTSSEPKNGMVYFGSTSDKYDNALKAEGLLVPEDAEYMVVYLTNKKDELPNIKIQKGYKATDWSPAPEDLVEEATNESKKYTDSQIKLSEDGISLGYKKYTDDKVGNIDINDRNLLLNSSNLLARWEGYKGSECNAKQVDMTEEWGTENAYEFSISGGTERIKVYYTTENHVSEPMVFDQEYTYSIFIKNTGKNKFQFHIGGIRKTENSGNKSIQIEPGESKHLSFTGVRRDNYDWFIPMVRTRKDYVDDDLKMIMAMEKIQKGNKATDWTPAPEDIINESVNKSSSYTDSQIKLAEEGITLGYKKYTDESSQKVKDNAKSYADNAVDNININDRNLLQDSANKKIGKLHKENPHQAEYDKLNVGRAFDNIEDKTEITISFDIETTELGIDNLRIYNTNNKGPMQISSRDIQKIPAGKTRQNVTTVVNSRGNDVDKDDSYIEFYTKYGTGHLFEITNVKIQRGNRATDWTPAPEDIDTKIDNIQGSGKNVLQNGSFENGIRGWKYPDGKNYSESIYIVSEGHSGKAIHLDSINKVQNIETPANIPVEPGQRYEISYWYRTSNNFDGTTSATKIRLARKSNSVISDKPFDTIGETWKKTSHIGTIPKDVYEMKVTVHSDGKNGWIEYDDIQVVNIDDIENAITESKKYTDSQIKLSEDGIKLGYKNYTDGKIKDVEERNKKTVTELEKSITQAKTSADSANQSIADMAKDTILSPLEKTSLAKEWETIQSEYPKLKAQAKKYGVSDTKLDAKYSSLKEYITPLLKEMDKDSTIKPTSFKQTFKEYYDEKLDIMNLINDRIKELGDIAVGEAYEYVDSQIDMTKEGISLGYKKYTDDQLSNQEIGGTNLLLDSDRYIKTSVYRTAAYDMSEKMEEITYTLTIKGKLGKDKNVFGAYISDDIHNLGKLKSKGNNIYQGTFDGRNDAENLKKLNIYAMPDSGTESEIEWAKLEKGNTATAWSPSPSDIESSSISSAKNYTDSQIKLSEDDIKLNYQKYTDNKVSSSEKKTNDTINGIQSSGENLIQNGNFENGFTGWDPAASASLTNNGRTSGKAVRMRRGSTKLMTSIPVEPGRTYEFGYWYRTSSDFDGITNNTKMRLGGPGGGYIDSKSYTGNTTEWKKLTRTRKIKSEDIYSLKISIVSAGSKGWIDFSEVYLIDITRYNETESSAKKYTESQIKLSEDGIKLGYKQYADDKVGNLDINDRNLLLNSSNLLATRWRGYKGSEYSTKQVDMTEEWGTENAYEFSISGGTSHLKLLYTTTEYVSEPMVFDQEYTYSIFVKNTGKNKFQFHINGLRKTENSGTMSIQIEPGESKHLSFTGVRRDNDDWFQPKVLNSNDDDLKMIMAMEKIQKGNKATDWTPAPEDLVDEATENAKDYSDTEIAKVGKRVQQAEDQIDESNKILVDMSKDDVLSPIDKKSLSKEWEQIQSEYPKLIAQGNKYGTNVRDIEASYSALEGYLIPIISQMGENTEINSKEFRSKFKEYYDNKLNLMNDVSDEVRKLGDAAASDAENRAKDYSDTSSDRAEQNAKNYADSSSNKAEQNAKVYTDNQIDITKDGIKLSVEETKEYADSSSNKAREDAIEYTDKSSDRAEQNAKDYADSSSNKAEQNAKDYTDSQIDITKEGIVLGYKNYTDNAVEDIDINDRNLLKGTSDEWELYSFENLSTGHFCYTPEQLGLSAGDTITYSVKLDNTKDDNNDASVKALVNFYDKDKKYIAHMVGNEILSGEIGLSCVTDDVPEGTNTIVPYDAYKNKKGNQKLVAAKENKLQYGNRATPWTPAPEDLVEEATNESKKYTDNQISITEEGIKSKVDKDGVISQINQSSEGVLIDGAKHHITGKTKIDNAVITSAMIKDIDASRVTVSANSGKKSVRMTKDGFVGYDSSGKLRLLIGVQDLAGDGQSDPSNVVFYSGNGKKSVSVGTNVDDTFVIGSETSGVTGLVRIPKQLTLESDDVIVMGGTNKSDYGDYWRFGTSTVGGKKHVAITTDRPYAGVLGHSKRFLRKIYTTKADIRRLDVGYGVNNPQEGDFSVRKDSRSGLIRSKVTRTTRTYSYSANVFITSYGTFGRSTSASKYKLNIQNLKQEEALDLGNRLLTLNPSKWWDKDETEDYVSELDGDDDFVDANNVSPHYGMVAEDLRDVGLDPYIQHDENTGEIEGIQYDRLWTPLIPIIREQRAEIEKLKIEVEKLKIEVEKLKRGGDA